MKKSFAVFLQGVIVLIGIAALVFLLVEPHFEGVNAQATAFEIYFKDPFLAYAYLASLSFFAVLYQGFKLLGFAKQNELFSQSAIRSLRLIKGFAMAMIGFVLGGEIWIMMMPSDDRAGGIAMGLFVIIASIGIMTVAGVVERKVRNQMRG